MLHGGYRLRHSGFRSRKRRNARRSYRSFTTTCSPRKHRDPPSVLIIPVINSNWTTKSRDKDQNSVNSVEERMRANRTSGIPVTVVVSVCALMLLFFASGTVHAKRGCSAFGHSCFGGHGKRFDPHIRDNGFPENEATSGDKNQELDVVRLSNEFAIPLQKFGGQAEMILPQTRRQDTSKFDPYTLPFIFGQWLTSHRRLQQQDLEPNNK